MSRAGDLSDEARAAQAAMLGKITEQLQATTRELAGMDIATANIEDIKAAVERTRALAKQRLTFFDFSTFKEVRETAARLGSEFDITGLSPQTLAMAGLIVLPGGALVAGGALLASGALETTGHQAGREKLAMIVEMVMNRELANLDDQFNRFHAELDGFVGRHHLNRPEEKAAILDIQALTEKLDLQGTDRAFIEAQLGARQAALTERLNTARLEFNEKWKNKWAQVGQKDQFSETGRTELTSQLQDLRFVFGSTNQVIDRGRAEFFNRLEQDKDAVEQSDRIRDEIRRRQTAGIRDFSDLDLSKLITKEQALDQSRFGSAGYTNAGQEFLAAFAAAADPTSDDLNVRLDFDLPETITNPNDLTFVELNFRGAGGTFNPVTGEIDDGNPLDTPSSNDLAREAVKVQTEREAEERNKALMSFLGSPTGIAVIVGGVLVLAIAIRVAL